MASDTASTRDTPAARGAAPQHRLTRTETLAHTVAAVGFLIQAITGLGSESVYDEVAGWPLLIHMFGAGVFLLGVAAVAIVWADRCRFGVNTGLNVVQKLVFWVALVLGLGVMLSMLVAMLPIFGTAGQRILLEVHECCGIAFLAVMIVHTVVSLAARRAQR